MRYWSNCLFAAALLLPAHATNASAVAPDHRAGESPTGKLEVYDALRGKWIPNCRATLISPQGHVLTAGHCVVTDPANLWSPYYPKLRLSFKGADPFSLSVIWLNPVSDSALLLASPDAATQFGWRVIDSRMVRQNDTLTLETEPRKTCTAISDQIHLAFTGGCHIDPGDSGAAVLLRDRLVGYVTRETEAVTGFVARALASVNEITPEPAIDGVASVSADPVPPFTPVDITVTAFNASRSQTALQGTIFLSSNHGGEANDCTFDSWKPQERHSCTLHVVPTRELRIFYRVAFAVGDQEHWLSSPWSLDDPNDSWPVYTTTVGVFDPNAQVWTGGGYGQTVRGFIEPSSPPSTVSAYIEYGLGDNFDRITHKIDAAYSFLAPLELDCGGLEYHYRAAALLPTTWPDPGGPEVHLVRGNVRSILSPPCTASALHQPTPHLVVTPKSECALFNWFVSINSNPSVTAFLEYGPDLPPPPNTDPNAEPFFSSISPGWQVAEQVTSNCYSIVNLQCNTRYHVRLNLWTPSGGLIKGPELKFPTAACSSSRDKCVQCPRVVVF